MFWGSVSQNCHRGSEELLPPLGVECPVTVIALNVVLAVIYQFVPSSW